MYGINTITLRSQSWQDKPDQYFMPQSAAIMRRWTESHLLQLPLLSAQGSLIPRSQGIQLRADGYERQNIEGNAYGIRVEKGGGVLW
jgi:hypothetical protein